MKNNIFEYRVALHKVIGICPVCKEECSVQVIEEKSGYVHCLGCWEEIRFLDWLSLNKDSTSIESESFTNE